MNEHFVMEKFEQMEYEALKSFGNLDGIVTSLSNVDEIKKTYLNPGLKAEELHHLCNEELALDHGSSQLNIVGEHSL